MSTKEITLEYASDELRFTGEPEEPQAREFLLLILRRIKLALKATRAEFIDREGQTLLVSSLPTAAEIYQGRQALLMNGGTGDDVPYVCMQLNGGSWAWKEIDLV